MFSNKTLKERCKLFAFGKIYSNSKAMIYFILTVGGELPYCGLSNDHVPYFGKEYNNY